MSYRRVTSVDHLRIKDGLDAGLSKTFIAGKLGFNKSVHRRKSFQLPTSLIPISTPI
ncbi:MAG: hypothetical protein JNM39_00590 [Bdellovibrionaceae bacterium]|nr:hypothetical protein [Pseudobdellovibrionaceae bacterium]